MGEAHAFSSQAVNMGCLVKRSRMIGAHIHVSEIIDEKKEDIGRHLRRCNHGPRPQSDHWNEIGF